MAVKEIFGHSVTLLVPWPSAIHRRYVGKYAELTHLHLADITAKRKAAFSDKFPKVTHVTGLEGDLLVVY